MSMSQNSYIGPAMKCVSGMKSVPQMGKRCTKCVSEGLNKTYTASWRGKFCIECGSALDEFILNQQVLSCVEHWEVQEKLNGNLLPIDELEKDGIIYWIGNRTIYDLPMTVYWACKASREITPEQMTVELARFVDCYRKEINVLEETYSSTELVYVNLVWSN